ncbi:hypothetical protein QR680_019313 [Steinernema hermaphroditum]|uniref:Uncharacterized protein n=1 Tax=Steinernema hermaphroditum TaxID=289476 RepID=A0AA39LAW1_9BILA|nr:hypothetical protein QR680_019313 [Steinernema hermaphroditum]
MDPVACRYPYEPGHTLRYGVLVKQAGGLTRYIPIGMPTPGDYTEEHVDKFFPIFCARYSINPVYSESRNIMNDNIIDPRRGLLRFRYKESGVGRTSEEARRRACLHIIHRMVSDGHIEDLAIECFVIQDDEDRKRWEPCDTACEEYYRQELKDTCWYKDPSEVEELGVIEDEPIKVRIGEDDTPNLETGKFKYLFNPPPIVQYEFPFDVKKFDSLGFLSSTMHVDNLCVHRMGFYECLLCKPEFNFFLKVFKKVLYSENPFESGIVLHMDSVLHDEIEYVMNPGRYCQIINMRPINDGEIKCTFRTDLHRTLRDYHVENSLPLSFLFRR